jgi:hypothetical protein
MTTLPALDFRSLIVKYLNDRMGNHARARVSQALAEAFQHHVSTEDFNELMAADIAWAMGNVEKLEDRPAVILELFHKRFRQIDVSETRSIDRMIWLLINSGSHYMIEAIEEVLDEIEWKQAKAEGREPRYVSAFSLPGSRG